MVHYVCLGTCGGKSEKAGVCTTEECPRYGMSLAECNCTDGQHQSAIEPEKEKGDGTSNSQKA